MTKKVERNCANISRWKFYKLAHLHNLLLCFICFERIIILVVSNCIENYDLIECWIRTISLRKNKILKKCLLFNAKCIYFKKIYIYISSNQALYKSIKGFHFIFICFNEWSKCNLFVLMNFYIYEMHYKRLSGNFKSSVFISIYHQ